jgi:hypothetical protein
LEVSRFRQNKSQDIPSFVAAFDDLKETPRRYFAECSATAQPRTLLSYFHSYILEFILRSAHILGRGSRPLPPKIRITAMDEYSHVLALLQPGVSATAERHNSTGFLRRPVSAERFSHTLSHIRTLPDRRASLPITPPRPRGAGHGFEVPRARLQSFRPTTQRERKRCGNRPGNRISHDQCRFWALLKRPVDMTSHALIS